MGAIPYNLSDPRYLAELAVKTMVLGIVGNKGLQVIITAERIEHIHPTLLVLMKNLTEEINPGTGIYRGRLECRLQQKLDKVSAEESDQQLRLVRQCFYRNDTDPRPMVDLANRLTKAIPEGFTCFGVVPAGEVPPSTDETRRILTYVLAFDLHFTPTR